MSAWGLLGVAGVAGLFFSLYRNDVLLNASRSGGWEPRYLALEARMLGRPGWGTPRSLSPQLQTATPEPAAPVGTALAPPTAVVATAAPVAAVAAAAPIAAVAAAPVAAAAPAAVSASPARATADGVAIVSLDALATLPVEGPRRAVPAAVAPAPARRVAESAPPARAVPERAAPVAAVAKAPVAKAPVAAPARPAAPVAAAPPVNENPLKAAIRTAIVKESQAK